MPSLSLSFVRKELLLGVPRRPLPFRGHRQQLGHTRSQTRPGRIAVNIYGKLPRRTARYGEGEDEAMTAKKHINTRQALIDQLKEKGITQIFGRPLYRCLKEELEFANRQNAPSYLSFSQINMYLKCGIQYYYRYILGLKLPPAGVMILGSAAHKGLEHDYKQKIKTHENLPTDEVMDVFNDTFNKEKDNAVWQEGEEVGDMKDKTAAVLKKYHVERAQVVQPIAVEKKVKVEFPNVDYDLIGYIDRIDEVQPGKYRIVDVKRKAKSMSEADVENDMQLTCYAFAHKEETGEYPAGLGFEVLVATKEPKVQLCGTSRTDQDCLRFLSVMAHVADGIYKNVFMPAAPGHWACSPKWCGYWDVCHKELV